MSGLADRIRRDALKRQGEQKMAEFMNAAHYLLENPDPTPEELVRVRALYAGAERLYLEWLASDDG